MKISQDPIKGVYQTSSCGFGDTSPEFENPTSDSATQESPRLSSFSLNLDDDDDDDDENNFGGSSFKRPIGVKKSKLKRKNDDKTALVINTLEEGNKQLLEQLKNTSAQRQHHLEIQSKNYALKKLNEENKILFHDVNFIQDPNICAYINAEQTRILLERGAQQQTQQAPQTSNPFEEYFKDLSGSGSDLPDF